MNADKSRQHQAGSDEDAELLSWTARDLPPGRHEFYRERLMTRIHELNQNEAPTAAPVTPASPEPTDRPARAGRRLRLLRPSVVLPVLATAVAGAVVAVTVTTGAEGIRDADAGSGPRTGHATGPALTTRIGTATSKGVPQLLDRLSLAAEKEPTPRSVRQDQYIYIESKAAGSHPRTVDGRTTLVSSALSRRQVWESPDGTKGWLVDPLVNDDPGGETLSLPDENGDIPKATLNTPSYDYLTKLTTDPGKLLAKIYEETEGMGNTPDQEAFTTIGDLLVETYPPARLSAALFKAAKKIPGVVVVPDAVDAIGRHGVAVARLDETGGQRDEWIFDRETGLLLGERSVQVRGNAGEDGVITPGTVISTTAVTERAVVDTMKQTPARSS
jgi:hypothetical protein